MIKKNNPRPDFIVDTPFTKGEFLGLCFRCCVNGIAVFTLVHGQQQRPGIVSTVAGVLR